MTEQHTGTLSLLQSIWTKLQFIPAPAVIATTAAGLSMQDVATALAVVLLLVQIASGITANWDRWSRIPGRVVRWSRKVLSRGRA
ncbi:hypothetical protein [Stenotrophomonas acidaminiphila]|uniref:hypothetical protein n=1 Tax=Stenotrophomonas acidaminiphila TaxID=128780 RepID=UPI0020C5DCC3|nr:hypothetical protein [Stenotrophomonas acidaminiphila]